MQAALLTIGNEILSGRTQDRHLRFLAPRMEALGIDVVETRTVGDEATAIQLAVWELQERRGARLLVTTGGLGPTHDDRTVAAIAALHGAPLLHHEPTWRHIARRRERAHAAGTRTGREARPGAARMALVPRGAHVWPNPVGAAPGLALQRALRTRDGAAWTIVLPGVPEELVAIWEAHAEPFLSMLVAGTSRARTVIELQCAAPEAEIAPILAATQTAHSKTRIGSYPTHGRPDILLRIDGHDPESVRAAADDLRRRLEANGVPITARAANP